MNMADKRQATWLFWGVMLAFWLALLTTLVVQGIQLGRGIGIGDGELNPGGQYYEHGGFNSIKAKGR